MKRADIKQMIRSNRVKAIAITTVCVISLIAALASCTAAENNNTHNIEHASEAVDAGGQIVIPEETPEDANTSTSDETPAVEGVSDDTANQEAEVEESQNHKPEPTAQESAQNQKPAQSNSAPTQSNNTGTSDKANHSKPNSNTQSQKPRPSETKPSKKWVEDKERVWVVDKPAWTEKVPIYETRELSICNNCGADITGNTVAHCKTHTLAGEGGGYHSEVKQVQTGTNIKNHPEEGHWETKVVGGHWE